MPRAVTSVNGEPLGHLPGGRRVRTISTCCSSRSTPRAPIASTRTASTAIETPNLDRLAREGVLFEQAVSPAPLTLPAHSSIFTGTFPPAHGVRDNGGFFLDERETTLAERLQARGFTTGGFVGAYVLDHKWGIAQGFQTYFDDFDLTQVPVAVARQRRSAGQRGRRPGAGVARHGRIVALLRLGAFLRRALAVRPARAVQVALRRASRTSARSRSSTRRSAGSSPISTRTTSPISTVVVVMGDHGESLGEHGEGTHGFFVYQATMHVPLLIRAPYDAMAGRRVADTVRSIDILPTALELLGVQTAGPFEGQQRRAADDRREEGARASPRIRGDLSALSFRLERPARADGGPLQVRRRAAAGAVRPAAGSGRDAQHLSPSGRRSAIA